MRGIYIIGWQGSLGGIEKRVFAIEWRVICSGFRSYSKQRRDKDLCAV